MGLRSPQQLEQVQVGVPNMPTVEAGKTSTIDLATPAKNFMEQKAIGDQIDSVNKQVRTRKDALIKIKSKYAIESVTGEYKSRMAALVGNNAVTESQGLVDQAARGLEDLKQKAPPALLEQVTRDAEIKLSELQNLMVDKIAVEARKDAINAGNSIVKTFTGEASSKFEYKDDFKEVYNKVHEFARDTEEMKGGGIDQQVFNSAAIASNSVVEGVKFSLAQKATPDAVGNLSDYFEKDILKDPDIHVTEPDITKIRELFNTAKLKAEDDLGYHLAAQAQKKMEADPKYTLEQARNDIFEGAKRAKGSGKVATQGYNLLKQIEDSKKAEVEKRDREKFGKIQDLTNKGKLAEAAGVTRTLSPEGELETRNYLNAKASGNAYTVMSDRKAQEQRWQHDPEAAAKYPIDNLRYNAADRLGEEARRRNFGRGVYDKKYAIDNGSMETSVANRALTIATERMGALKLKIDSKMKAGIVSRSNDIFQEERDKYPEMTRGELMLRVEERLRDPETGVLKDVVEPNALGRFLGNFGVDTSTSSWMNDIKTQARPREEFKNSKRSGREDEVRIVEPTAVEVLQFQDEAAEAGEPVTQAQAREIMREERRKKAKAAEAAAKAKVK